MIEQIPTDDYERIESEISSAESPVGIDAKKTHVLILYMLARIEERLARLEAVRASIILFAKNRRRHLHRA